MLSSAQFIVILAVQQNGYENTIQVIVGASESVQLLQSQL